MVGWAFLMVAAAVQSSGTTTEAYKFDYLRVKDRVEAHGETRRTMEVGVLLRTPAAVQQFGQIGSFYVADYGEVAFEGIRVQKPSGATTEITDGRLEDLNPFGINDSAIPADIRMKKLTLARLEPGDRLSYTLITTLRPFVPGEAYGEMKFLPVSVEGPQIYELDIPAASRLTVTVRPGLGVAWETVPGPPDRLIRRLTATIPPTVVARTGLTEAQSEELRTPDVSFTTFPSWAKVGEWWWDMSRAHVRGDETTRREAERVVAGKKTAREKIEAIAWFVGASVRYLNVGFGIGRMQPRPATTVLGNRYGDCKDKIGLVMAMAEAVGVEVRPVLISNARRELQDDAPGPHQFDHAIAVAILGPQEKDWLWIDATNSLSSPMTLMPSLRDKRALMITPQRGTGQMVRTPPVPPEPARKTVTLTGQLDPSGLLKGRVRLEDRSDSEPTMRTRFASVRPEQHAELLKATLGRTWTEARISSVQTADPVDLAAPFWFEFDFERDVSGIDSEKEWKLWVPDLGPTLLDASSDTTARKPVVFEVGEVTFTASVELPEQVSARAPLSISMDRPFASLATRYVVSGRTLKVERTFRLPVPSISRDQVPAYEALRKAASTDREQEFVVGPVKAAAPAASALQKEGKAAYEKEDYPRAIGLLERAAAADPTLKDIHYDLGLALRWADRYEEALGHLTKAIEANAFHDDAYAERAYVLFELERGDEAEKDLLKQIEVAPFKTWSYGRLAQLRNRQGRPLEAAEMYMKALAIDGTNVNRWLEAAWAYAKGGKPEDSKRGYEKARSLGLKAGQRVQAAFGYRLMGDLTTAGSLAQEDLGDLTKTVSGITPKSMDAGHVYWVRRLAQAWMIVGEAALEMKDTPKAEKFLKAGWELGILPDAAFALGRIREAQGKFDQALELWAAAATLGNWETRPPDLEARMGRIRSKGLKNDGFLEMARLRFISVPGGSSVTAKDEVLILVSEGKVVEALNTSKANEAMLAPVLARLAGQPASVNSPDGTPQSFLRTGTLECTSQSGCQFLAKIESAISTASATFDSIRILSMAPANKSTITAGAVVHLTVTASYDFKGSDPGTISLVVNGDDPSESLVRPLPKRSVSPGKGTVDFDVTFTVPKRASAVRIFLPLGTTNTSSIQTVASAEFRVVP